MPKLFDWRITMHPMDARFAQHLKEMEYLGKEDFFFLGHGNVTDSPKFWDGERIHTSPVKRLEYLAKEELLRIHTMNSIYDCDLHDCDFQRQESLAVLPFPLEMYAEKYKFGRWDPPERDSILLVFANYKKYGLRGAWVNWNGMFHCSDRSTHLGMFQDSCLLQFRGKALPKTKRLKKIDIRFFPPANFVSDLICFYSFETAGFPVDFHNAGEKKMLFDTKAGRIELEPGERKRVSAENAVNSNGKWVNGMGFLYDHGSGDGDENNELQG